MNLFWNKLILNIKANTEKQNLHKSPTWKIIRGKFLYNTIKLINSKNREQKLLLIISFNIFIITFSAILIIIIRKYISYYYPLPLTSLLFLILICISSIISIYLSNKNQWKIGAISMIFLLYIGMSYASLSWGISLPATILSSILVITISSTLLGSKYGLIVSVLCMLSLLIAGIREINNQDILYWTKNKTHVFDILIDLLFISAITTLSWLSSKETEKSLRKAILSEKALQKERDSLEEIVRLKTAELKFAHEEQINQLYKFSEFGRIASGLFHDLFNPLNSVSLIIENLDYKKIIDKNIKKQINLAIESSKKIRALLESGKKCIRHDEELETIDINGEIKKVITLVKYITERKGIEIEFLSYEERLIIYTKKSSFTQVILNLLSNAFDAIDERILNLNKKSVKIDKKVIIRTYSDKHKEKIYIEIKDTGIGISEENKNLIFDSFYTTKKEKGMGLGLAIVKRIVEKEFLGLIESENVKESGAKFKIIIPNKKIFDQKLEKYNKSMI